MAGTTAIGEVAWSKQSQPIVVLDPKVIEESEKIVNRTEDNVIAVIRYIRHLHLVRLSTLNSNDEQFCHKSEEELRKIKQLERVLKVWRLYKKSS